MQAKNPSSDTFLHSYYSIFRSKISSQSESRVTSNCAVARLCFNFNNNWRSGDEIVKDILPARLHPPDLSRLGERVSIAITRLRGALLSVLNQKLSHYSSAI